MAGQEAQFAAIHDAVARLAGVCDFAESQDGQGFNGADTWLGHVLAAMPAGAWTADEALAAWDMLRKYRGQLAALGVEYDDLPEPPGAAELAEARRAEARERARQRGRNWRREQYRKARSHVRCDGPGEPVVLAFPYDPAMVEEAKAIPGRSFDWDAKANVYPFGRLPLVVAFAGAHGIDVAPEVRALVPAAVAHEEREAARPDVLIDDAGRVVISAPYDPGLNEALKELNGGRSTWDKRARVHRPPVHRDPGRLLEIAAEFGLTVGDDARRAVAAEVARQERNRAAAAAVTAGPVPVPGLAEGAALKPQQWPVVRFAVEHRRVLIGDDMGWGKTLSSLAAVAADGAYPAVVVCRPSLTLNWVAEIRRFFPGLAVFEASGTTPRPVPEGTDVVVIGSAALAALAARSGSRSRPGGGGDREFGWVAALAASGPRALIIDEGQDTKERTAARTRACGQLAADIAGRGGLVLDLTGTAILNRPRELCQQLSILGRIGEFGGPKAFLWRYCLAEVNEWGADYDGARNLGELHDRLLSWGIMIRRSDDAALGLPPCREHVIVVPEAGLDPEVMARYRQAEADLTGFLAGQARSAALELGAEPGSAAVRAAMRARAAEHLVAIGTLRQLAGQAKREWVLAWVRERVAAGEKVVVAAHHRSEVDAYAAAFGGLKLQGGQPVAEKEAVKAAFQQGSVAEAPVIAVAIDAGGVGHTLTAARVGIQAEQAWTPGETQQMKKRLHRIGQDRPVDYYITVAEGTIDEHLRDVITIKQARLDAVLDGRDGEGIADDENSVAAEVAWRLARQGLDGTDPGGYAPAPDPGPQPGPSAGPQASDSQSAREPEADREPETDREAQAGHVPARAGHLRAGGGGAPPGAADRDADPAAASGPVTGSVLDDVTLARMRAEVAAKASPFADPALLRDAQAVLPAVPGEWLSRVAGRAVASYRSLTSAELVLAMRAARADSAHLESLAAQRRAGQQHASRVAAEAAAARAQRERDQWEALQARLPVPVAVQHNWTARHLDGYEQGADHIVVLEDLNRGRYHRSAGDPLCWTPSRARQLRYVHASPGDEHRIPDCTACLQHAERIAQPAEAGETAAGEQGTVGQAGPGAGSVPAADVSEGRAVAADGRAAARQGSGQNRETPARDRGVPGRTTPSAPAVRTRWTATCARCHAGPPGPGGILCPSCKTAIEARNAAPPATSGRPDDDGDDGPAVARGRELRQAARRYLDHGLLPVPAWGTRPGSECCCPRGASCPRPGKHPRSVHTGPGERDFSWKPLACASFEEIDQRLADGGPYADGNLMLAIPEGMLVIDQDDDDGGRQAIEELASQLGDLPETLSHRTPHGAHRIYRTPPGWTTRAWVGKDARNPLPAGIDLRVPGQILMAPPSRVSADGGLVGYGPVTGSKVADLPAAYVTAWTPPAEPARAPRPALPVPPGKADTAAAYVHARVSGITEELATREPGGRNTAIYTAALKVGSTLGAARSTPGAEDAAAAWTDEAAEDALMNAAERNGYIADHSAAAARTAIRSGLRNGLRRPRPLPDFRSGPVADGRERRRSAAWQQPGTHERAGVRSESSRPLRAASPDHGAVAPPGRTPAVTADPRAAQRPAPVASTYGGPAPELGSPRAASRDGPDGRHVIAALQEAGFTPSSRQRGTSGGAEGFLARPAPDGGIEVRHAAIAEAIDGIAPWDRTDQMLDRYARTLRRADFDATRTGPHSLTVSGRSADRGTRNGIGLANTEPDSWTLANQTAAAANAAYRAGDFDQARQFTDKAAELDPTRASLWQRHRAQIDAKSLLHQARAARTEGDQARACALTDQATRLDPRMTALWDQDLPLLGGPDGAQPDHVGGPSLGTGLMREPDPRREAYAARQAAGPQRPARLGPDSLANADGKSTLPRTVDALSAAAAEAGPGAAPSQRQRHIHLDLRRDTPENSIDHRAGRAAPPDWRENFTEREREVWQPPVVSHDGEPQVAAVETEPAEIGG